jgi:AraC-like DNA-binding protein
MSLTIFPPCTLLKPYVIAIVDYQNLLSGNTLSILPDTASYLCFLYQDELITTHKAQVYSTRSGLAGFQNFRNDLGSLGNVSGVSALLTPWGLNVFRQGIVKDCADKRVDCRDIFANYIIEKIEDNLARQKMAIERVQYIEQFLLSVLNPYHADLLIQTACMTLNKSHGHYSITQLARLLGLSKRTLERRFQYHIGTTPKKYARIVRLRHAILQRQTLDNWAEVAYAAGYYDQSHMINEFQELYGLSPEIIYPQIEQSKIIHFSGLLNLQQTPH